MAEPIREGYDVFLKDGGKSVGAVRALHAAGIVIYVENAGDFEVPLNAVKDVHSQKVILEPRRLGEKLQEAILRAHVAEDPRIP